MSFRAGKPGDEEGLDELRRKTHALARGEDVVDEPRASTDHLVGRDAGPDSATTERYAALDLAGGDPAIRRASGITKPE